MTYRIYFDEFCPEFIEWLRNKFRVIYEGKNFMIIDLVHTDAQKAAAVVDCINRMIGLDADSAHWDSVTSDIISHCPWM